MNRHGMMLRVLVEKPSNALESAIDTFAVDAPKHDRMCRSWPLDSFHPRTDSGFRHDYAL